MGGSAPAGSPAADLLLYERFIWDTPRRAGALRLQLCSGELFYDRHLISRRAHCRPQTCAQVTQEHLLSAPRRIFDSVAPKANVTM